MGSSPTVSTIAENVEYITFSAIFLRFIRKNWFRLLMILKRVDRASTDLARHIVSHAGSVPDMPDTAGHLIDVRKMMETRYEIAI